LPHDSFVATRSPFGTSLALKKNLESMLELLLHGAICLIERVRLSATSFWYCIANAHH